MSVIQGDIGGSGGSDATISMTDITTNNASTSKHGFLLKLDGTATKFLRDDGSWQTITGGGDALTSNPLSQFASTNSAQLAGVLSDETGSGVVVFSTSPTLVTPVLGAATATSVNKVAVTAPATSATLTIADGATLTASATATVSGTHTGTSSGTNTGDQSVSTMGVSGALTDGTGTLLITHGGTSSTSASAARTALGLAIGTDVQAQDAELAAIAGLTSAADSVPYFTGSGTAALATLTTAGRAIIDDADAAAQRTTLGLGSLATQSGTFSGTSSGTNTGDVANTALTTGKLSQFAATSSSELAGVISDETGSGLLVFGTSPTLTTPTIGVATATSVNKVAITAPATSATLAIADGVTLTVSASVDTNNLAPKASPTLTTPTLGVATATSINKVAITAPATSATITVADGVTLTVPATASVQGTHSGASSGTNTGDQTISDATISTSDITTNNFTTAKHGFVPKGTNVGSFLKDDGTWAAIPGGGDALTSNPLSQFAATTSLQLKGVISDETGSGALTFATSPTLVTPTLGVATVTSVNKVAITAPATSATIAVADGKTLTVSNDATISGTNTGDVANTAVTTGKLSQFAATSSSELAGVISDETGSGLLVFATSPTLTTPVLGVAAATSLALGNGNITAAKQVCFNSMPTANKTGAAPNLADWTTGSLQEIVLTGNVTGTPTFTAPTGASRLTLRVKQDGTGSRTIAAWPSGVRWPGGTAPTLSTAANKIDYITFIYDGTNYDGMFGAGTTGGWA